MQKGVQIILLVVVAVVVASCTAGVDNPGLEYAPQMYHSTPYEPLSQVQDESMGTWLDSNPEDGHGEFYNSNPYNPYGMTMLEPVENTIKRGSLPNHIAKDDFETAAIELVNPLDSTKEVVAQGKALYERFCIHCHGSKGAGDGLVGQVFLGVTAYNSATVVDKPGGHIYHVITHGKGRMGSHASQLSEEERWKIVRYVQVLQKQ
ncbi:MAG: cytochrome c [Cyclobacteriaceae bacterium]|nr:cytochrome c [Cyclobacteriaceae bacterium SS2]